MNLRRYDSEAMFVKDSVKVILNVIDSAAGIVRIALSGGSTPQPVYKVLGRENADFGKVHFYVLDERYVPIEHPDSNAGMIERTLFASGSRPATFVHFDTSKDIRMCVDDFSSRLPDENFDLMILGAGEDGHIAGLFPRGEKLYRSGYAAYTRTDRFEVKARLTMTLTPILDAGIILLLLKGATKQGVVEMMHAENLRDEDFPVRYLRNHPQLIVHYLEK